VDMGRGNRDHFAAVFGEHRGVPRPDEDARDLRRRVIFDALLQRVPDGITEDLDLRLHDGMRYVALARGDADQCLYVVGAALTLDNANAFWESEVMGGLFPEAIIDLEAPSPEHCIVTDASKGEEWGSGIEDLQPYLRE